MVSDDEFNLEFCQHFVSSLKCGHSKVFSHTPKSIKDFSQSGIFRTFYCYEEDNIEKQAKKQHVDLISQILK